jgi:hypothetical protein
MGVGWPSPGPVTAAPSTITLGNTVTSSTYSVGWENATYVPVYFYNASGGYTLNTFYISVNSANPVNLAIYSDGTSANCPSVASHCAISLQSYYSDVTVSTGTNSFPVADFSSNPTFSGSQFLWLCVASYTNSVTLNAAPAQSFCPGTGFFQLTASVGGSSIPSTAPTQSEPGGSQCSAVWATFNCVSGCGSALYPFTLFTWAGNTNGGTVSTTNVLTGAYGYNGSIGGTLTSATTYSNSETQGYLAAVPYNGSTYSGGSMSVYRSSSDTDYIDYSISGGYGGAPTACSLTWLYNDSNTLNAGPFDLAEIGAYETTGNSIFAGAWGGSGNCSTSPCLRMEEINGSTGTLYYGSIPFSSGTWIAVWLYLNTSGTNHEMAAFSTTGSQIASATNTCADGKTICASNTGTAGIQPTAFNFMDLGGGASGGPGDWWYGSIVGDMTGASCAIMGTTYGKMFFPDSPGVIGPVLSARVERGEIPRARIINGRWYSPALGTYLAKGFNGRWPGFSLRDYLGFSF